MVWGMRHLDTLEVGMTRLQYLRALLDFKRWCCKELPRQKTARIKGDGVLEHEDEIGRYIDDDMGDLCYTDKDDLLWMHGPRVNATRIRAYILSIARQKGIAKAAELEELKAEKNKDAHLHHSYAARHLEEEMCAVGHTLLWLHFVYDQLSRSPTSRFVPPLDFSTPYMWYHKHLFHARNDKIQKQLPASSHSRITKEMWRTNKIFITRNTHAARAGGAQELADDGVPQSDIADLGHWALDKLAKSYITTIPKAAILRKAGYTGKRGDYHLGRSMAKPDDKVVALIAQHIFPWAEAELA
ncbi:unnamed protein product [Closterium sp. NIES-65]|nr:unnamed protein product [Closterium sp. NIES-65]